MCLYISTIQFIIWEIVSTRKFSYDKNTVNYYYYYYFIYSWIKASSFFHFRSCSGNKANPVRRQAPAPVVLQEKSNKDICPQFYWPAKPKCKFEEGGREAPAMGWFTCEADTCCHGVHKQLGIEVPSLSANTIVLSPILSTLLKKT